MGAVVHVLTVRGWWSGRKLASDRMVFPASATSAIQSKISHAPMGKIVLKKMEDLTSPKKGGGWSQVQQETRIIYTITRYNDNNIKIAIYVYIYITYVNKRMWILE